MGQEIEMDTVDHQLVEIALQRADGPAFERFCQAFFAVLTGLEFVPLGGVQDGGADAFVESGVFEAGGADHFWQVSVEKNTRSKIRRTTRRLREFGRTPAQLTYCTSVIVPRIDHEEDLLSNEIGLRVRIRDQKYITSQINYSPKTVQAFNSYLSPFLGFLRDIGGTTFLAHHPGLPARSLCVFLGQEVERRRGNTQLLEAVTDSLVLWALEGTDPDKGIFLERNEILQRIEQALPATRHFIRGVINNRLTILSSKGGASGREVRWHKKEDKFCLPYETRQLVEQENVEDESLKTTVSDVFKMRISEELDPDEFEEMAELVVSACHSALEVTFEKQGLELAYYFSDDESEDYVTPSISENVDSALEGLALDSSKNERVKELSMDVLRRTFYDSTEAERIYLSKLSRTYTLLFSLKNEPRIVEYFRTMSKSFVLYIGADLIIRALSEYFLSEEDRITWNTFNIVQAAGSATVLTEKALEEVISHIRATDLEFRNFYQGIETSINREFARHIDRILIRAYFYARLDSEPKRIVPNEWTGYIALFCTYSDLHSEAGKDSLRRYLCEEFGFSFESSDEMLNGVKEGELEELKSRIVEARKETYRDKEKEELLAYNDALQVLRIYAKRKELGETRKPNPYGYRTWWLTHETVVRRATAETIRRKSAQYMMRPEFLLNFIALSPSTEEVRQSFGNVFPSLLGVKLSNRMRDDVFKQVVQKVKESYQISEARARATVGELSDKLKGDYFKRYEVELRDRDEG